MKSVSSGIFILWLGVTILMSGCGSKERAEVDTATQSTYTVPVQVASAQMQQLIAVKTYSGPVEGEEQASIIARVSERVTGIKARVGDAVAADKVIIVLDKSGATSQFYQAEASYRNAQKTLERMKSLYGEGAISLQALDGAQTAFDVSKANFDAAKSTVELTTPIAGAVTAVNVTEGDLTTPGSTLATVASIGRMKVTFNINETDVTNLGIGQKVQVYSETRPDLKVEGKIIQLAKSADPRSRSFEIKAIFPNTKDRWFKPGMFCKVIVEISGRDKVLAIPVNAVQSDGTTDRVFVIRNGHSFMQSVQLGINDGENVAILSGLKVNDVVATTGANNLKDSSAVTVVKQ